jgi:catechol 2,3-dioxygenase-like lactoylglutathione lyase family enzyme
MAGIRLDHVARATTDVQRLARFYEEIFGFQRIDSPTIDFEIAWLSTVPPSFSLHIIQKIPNSNLPDVKYTKDPELPQRRSHHISFVVTDYDGFVKSLREKGIPFYEKTQQEGKVKQVVFCDPDGNALEVANWPQRQ